MKKTAYGKPVYIKSGNSTLLNRIENIEEITIQNLVFENPECLPISDIDESYNPMIPVCKELRTPAGPLDILMVTPNGDLSIIETKLWRNPEARRKVIAQILDYANELSKWSYEDLQREVNRTLQKKGNTLYKIATCHSLIDKIDEATFVDSVSRNLRRCKFLLLIVGDGIKEGAISITEFLSNAGHMNFAFGMIELSIFSIDEVNRIVIPRTIVKTTEIQKLNINLLDGLIITNNSLDSASNNQSKNIDVNIDARKQFFTQFWIELLAALEFDDPGQALPNPTSHQNIYLYPNYKKNCWISAYFSQSSKRVGVYFRCQNNETGEEIANYLMNFKEELKRELGDKIVWNWESSITDGFAIRLSVQDVYQPENRELIKDFFLVWLNKFVNAIRPRLKELYSNESPFK